MITLNLLSPQKKKETEENILYASIKNILAIFLIFIIFVSVILLGSKLILSRNFEKVIEQTTLIVKEYGGVNRNIKEINDKLINISKSQEEFIEWSSNLLQTAKLVPENIEISAIVLRKGSSQTLLKGYAKTRGELLILKTNLEESELFEKVELPFSNLLKREDIDFEFQLTLSEEL
ncbi:MAG: hypothetical protein HQ536_04870 [Parcubacteria group bacterium]|nr:hypothetical protein [Parcubacteria group bacterium]